MNKKQIWVISACAVLFAILYFGFSIKNPNPTQLQNSSSEKPSAALASHDFENIVDEAVKNLNSVQNAALSKLSERPAGMTEVQIIERTKEISAFWYQNGNPLVAAIFAEQVAKQENNANAWSIAGGNFFEAIPFAQEQIQKDICARSAISAFAAAAKLEPKNVEHEVNQALVLAENPLGENPMAAVLKLRELEKNYPNEPAVFNALGRLAIKTGQWDRAVERLERAYQLDAKNAFTPCLLAKAYAGKGDNVKAADFQKICESPKK